MNVGFYYHILDWKLDNRDVMACLKLPPPQITRSKTRTSLFKPFLKGILCARLRDELLPVHEFVVWSDWVPLYCRMRMHRLAIKSGNRYNVCFKQNETIYFASGICKKCSFTQWKWEAHHMSQHITDALAWFRKMLFAHYKFTSHLELFITSNNKAMNIQCDITEHCNVIVIILCIFPFFSPNFIESL